MNSTYRSWHTDGGWQQSMSLSPSPSSFFKQSYPSSSSSVGNAARGIPSGFTAADSSWHPIHPHKKFAAEARIRACMQPPAPHFQPIQPIEEQVPDDFLDHEQWSTSGATSVSSGNSHNRCLGTNPPISEIEISMQAETVPDDVFWMASPSSLSSSSSPNFTNADHARNYAADDNRKRKR